MALITKNPPFGVDVVIDKLQRDLFKELTITFGWRNYDSFPRVRRNKRGDETVPEVYIGSGDYKEVLFDDTKTVNSFFLADEKPTYDAKEHLFSQSVNLIVQANVKQLGVGTEQMINQVELAIRNRRWDMRLKGVTTGVDKVYDSLKITYDKKYFDNMSNFFIARFDFVLMFYTKQNQTLFLQ